MRAKTKYIHVSFDEVKEFVPRIPDQRCDHEDSTIKRICTAPDIFHAINAMPRGGEALWNMNKFGMPLFFHAYYLTAESKDIVKNKDILHLVPDAFLTKEEWFTGRPKTVKRIDYVIEDPVFIEKECTNNLSLHFLAGGRLKRVKHQESWDVFWKWITGEDKAKDKVKNGEVSFGLFIQSIDLELHEEIVKRKESIEKKHIKCIIAEHNMRK